MARFYMVWLAGVVLAVLAAGPAAAADGPPCAPCVRLSVTPEQAQQAPADLHVAAILVRTGAGADAAAVSSALAALRASGATGGLHASTPVTADDPAFDLPADVLVVEPQRPLDPDEVVALKTALARARGAHPRMRLLLAAPAGSRGWISSAALIPYVDDVVPPSRAFRSVWDAMNDQEAAAWIVPQSNAATGALRDIAALQAAFPRGLASVPERAIRCDGHALSTFVNAATLDLVAYGDCAPGASVTTDVPGGRVDRFTVEAVDVIRIEGGDQGRFTEHVQVATPRDLAVEEIVARHQAFAARQTSAIRTRISDAAFTLTFEAPGFPAPVSVTSRTVIFAGTEHTDLLERDIRVNGAAFPASGGVPRLPLVEPARVASPPLAIALTGVYRYRLEGRSVLRGRPCYVVAFTPGSRASGSLFEGRAWIDAETFAAARIDAVQTDLRGPITASEQIDDFAADANGWWLPTRSEIRQRYQGATLSTPIHRLLVYERHELNPRDFDQRLASAHASADVMLRDTPQGYRYLTRQADENAQAAEPTRTVSPSAGTRVRTLAFGVLVDPDISRPLPFAGLSYVDFDVGGTGAELSAFFGGAFAQAAFSAPSLGGTRWQLGAKAFAIAASYNDRAFEQGREIYTKDIRQRPASASVWLLRPVTPQVSVRAEYGFDYVWYGRGPDTDAAFVIPASQVAHALRLGIEAQRAGWNASAWWSGATRRGWRPWGLPNSTSYRRADRDFQRVGGSLARTMVHSSAFTVRIEAAGMAGSDLDRFSRFSFGAFDNQLRGFPAALIRFDRGLVLHNVASWTMRGLRLDALADSAEVHDPAFGRGMKNYTGLGSAVEVPGPFHTLLTAEWSYGFQGIDADGGRGTQVVRIAGYKVF